jgi:hypothetical protein
MEKEVSYKRFSIGYILLYDSVMLFGVGWTVPLPIQQEYALFSIASVPCTKIEALLALNPILTVIAVPLLVWVVLPSLFIPLDKASCGRLEFRIRTAIAFLLGNACFAGMEVAIFRNIINQQQNVMIKWIFNSPDSRGFWFVVLIIAPIIGHACGFSWGVPRKVKEVGLWI